MVSARFCIKKTGLSVPAHGFVKASNGEQRGGWESMLGIPENKACKSVSVDNPTKGSRDVLFS